MIRPLYKRVSRQILDLFFPRNCLVTGEKLGEESAYRYFSEEGVKGFDFVGTPHCYTCGYPFDGVVEGARQCPSCIELKPVFTAGRTGFLLKEGGKKLVHELKYHQGFHLWPDVGEIVKKVPDYVDFIGDGVLVPVPLHPRKERARGFNQSLLLAKALAKASKGGKVEDILRRVRYTKSQTRLTKEERRRNVSRAFGLCFGAKCDKTTRYILVDDVFTTGATLNACAKVLKRHGAKEINIITLGHG